MSYTVEIAGMLLRGPIADRPAASVGRYWYLADDEDGTLYKSNGSVWTQVSTGTTGGSGIPQGGPLTEDLDADSNTIINLVDPTNDQDAATKKYVDDNAGGGGYASGTSFPGSPSANDVFYRTDILGGTLFKYDGTRWRSVSSFTQTIQASDAAAFQGLSANTSAAARGVIAYKGTYGFYLLEIQLRTIVVTTNNGTNFWTLTATSQPGGSSLGSFNTSGDTATTHTFHSIAVNAVVTNTDVYLNIGATKTLSPGNLFLDALAIYQLVAT